MALFTVTNLQSGAGASFAVQGIRYTLAPNGKSGDHVSVVEINQQIQDLTDAGVVRVLTIVPDGGGGGAYIPRVLAVVAGTAITVTHEQRQKVYLSTAGDVVMTADPQIEDGNIDGQELLLEYVGAHTLTLKDSMTKVKMNGDCVMVLGSSIKLNWNLADQVWDEEGRNDI